MLKTLILSVALANSGSAEPSDKIKAEFEKLASSFDGKAGICAMPDLNAAPICVHGSELFPLQSVMKLIVAAAVLDKVDAGKMKLTDTILVTPQDGSPGPREFYDLIVKSGTYKATVEELIRRSNIDSDSTAVDVLIRHLGGIEVVQSFLKEKNIEGIRIDRDERTVQSEFYGLTWKAEYANPEAFKKAIDAQSKAARLKALEAYLKDPRDTASPEGMNIFLKRLFTTKILSLKSTEKLLFILEKTATGSNRLRAGIPTKWSIGHKTGTSASLDGRVPTTNDVGVITSPEGQIIPIAVFLFDSKKSDAERGAVFAKAARIVTSGNQKRGH